MLVVTFAFALFLAALNQMGTPVSLQVTLSALLWSVGAVQMVVPVRHVRSAAMISGCVVCFAAFMYAQMQSRGRIDPGSTFAAMVCGVFWASFLGYIAGVVVAGIFLVADQIRNGAIRRLGREDE
mgnify:CR=1 FL=1|tara:strand:- start:35100 stop:35474 length:375 start_codon:yes stop_codon:yes gene_type:complete